MSNPMKILVVDDESVGRHLLEAILIPEGYSVLFGENGEEAVEVANAEIPDMILCDVMMPKLDGFGVCKKIRENENTAHIPVFLITALDDRDSRIRGIDAGADDYISKPFDRLEILAKVKNHANLIKYRLGGKKAPLSNSVDTSSVKQYNSTLLRALTLSLERTNNPFLNIESYRTSLASESQHTYTFFANKAITYTLLVSNHLEASDALIANTVFIRLVEEVILEEEKSPNKLIARVLERIKQLINMLETEIFRQADYSVAIIYTHHERKEVVVSGLNQVLIANTSKSTLSEVGDREYQAFYLMGNQDISVEPSAELLLFSPNSFRQINHQDLCSLLNKEKLSGVDKSLEDTIAPVFNQTQDVLVIKITFQIPI